MIYFPKEGCRYKTGLNIKIFKRVFFKITLLFPIPLFSHKNYSDWIAQDFILSGWRICIIKISYLRFWDEEDVISFESYFRPIGKGKIVNVLNHQAKCGKWLLKK